jgi:hypothetical protein
MQLGLFDQVFDEQCSDHCFADGVAHSLSLLSFAVTSRLGATRSGLRRHGCATHRISFLSYNEEKINRTTQQFCVRS